MTSPHTVRQWARALGGDVSGRDTVLCPGPGHSRRDRSLAVRLAPGAPDGFVVYSHAGDDPLECRDHVRDRVGLGQFQRGRRPARDRDGAAADAGWERHREQRRRLAAALWRRSAPAAGTVVETYLRRARGITGALPPTVRFLEGNDRWPPTMVTAFGTPEEDADGRLVVDRMTVEAVHLTALEPDGRWRAGKRMIGRPSGVPLVLAPFTDALALVVAEGIEDALTARDVTGLAAWAAGSAAHMAKLSAAVPSFVETVTILEDANDAGRAGATRLAEALERRGIETRRNRLRTGAPA